MSRKDDAASQLLNEGNPWADEGGGQDDALASLGQQETAAASWQQEPAAGAWAPAPSANPEPALEFQENNFSQDVTGRVGTGQPPASTSQAAGQPGPSRGGGEGQGGGEGKGGGIFSLDRYRKLFDVDTQDVLDRMLASSAMFWKSDFLEMTQDNPDLYGPFWIASTLIFVVAAMGNIVSYVNFRRRHPDATHAEDEAGDEQLWYLDADKALWSIMLFYGYVSIVPIIFWAAFKFFKSSLGLTQSITIFGYSLTLFIPIGIFCALPFEWLQWILVLGAFALSGTFLALNLNAHIAHVAAEAETMLRGRMSVTSLKVIIACMVVVFHFALALVLKLYFFAFEDISAPANPDSAPTPAPTTAPTEAPTPTPGQ